MKVLRSIAIVAAVVMTAASAQAEWRDPPGADAVRHVIKGIWDKPGEAVEVSPVIVVADHAVAGWTQGDMGGRALLHRKNHAWVVVLCAGDQLLDPKALVHAGITEDAAQQLAAATKAAERQTPSARVAMFSRFEGLIAMEDHPN